MKFSIFSFLALFLASLVGLAQEDERSDALLEAFQNPPAEARPFARWWWNGNCVEEEEILRELDVLHAAGIAGVEINPIAMPDEAKRTDAECLVWGSPEWARMVKLAIEGCAERGMVADIIIGSGWPFGGEFLETDETIPKNEWGMPILVGEPCRRERRRCGEGRYCEWGVAPSHPL